MTFGGEPRRFSTLRWSDRVSLAQYFSTKHAARTPSAAAGRDSYFKRRVT
jgi:hypothetical protein